MIINKVESPEAKFVVACFSRLGAQIMAETYLLSSAKHELAKLLKSYSAGKWEVMTVEEYNQRVEKLQSGGGAK